MNRKQKKKKKISDMSIGLIVPARKSERLFDLIKDSLNRFFIKMKKRLFGNFSSVHNYP